MRFDLISLFPDMFPTVLGGSILGRARAAGLIDWHLHNPRDFTHDRHRSVDDAPYGGGAGMVMRPDPLVSAVESVPRAERCVVIMMSPRGERLTQRLARELAGYQQLVLVCGRYEGVDERALRVVDREISVGDFVVSGGELPAMLLIDAVARLIPGVLGNVDSAHTESFESGLLEYPHYTRPEEYRGERVPEVLLSGHHGDIARWRREQALLITARRRPDLLFSAEITPEEREWLRLQGLLPTTPPTA